MLFTRLTPDIVTYNIIPYLFEDELGKEDYGPGKHTVYAHKFRKLRNIFHMFNLINTSKYFYSFDNTEIWKYIHILIYPKSYSIGPNSIHMFEKTYACIPSTRDWDEIRERPNTVESRRNKWQLLGCPCNKINHYDINTLICHDKNYPKHYNYKIMLTKQIRNHINKGSVNEYKDISNKLQKNIDTEIIKLQKNIDTEIIKSQKQLETLQKQKQLANEQQELLIRLNYTIDGQKTKKKTAYSNFITYSKELHNKIIIKRNKESLEFKRNNPYPYYCSKTVAAKWKSMTKTEKDKYK